MFRIKFSMIGESFMPIGPRAEAELQEKRSKYQFWLHPWTSAAAHNAFSKITVSLKQAKRHWTLFQRWLFTWNKRSGTWRFFKDDGVLEASEAALDAFSKMAVYLKLAKAVLDAFSKITVSLKEVKRHLELQHSRWVEQLNRWRAGDNKNSMLRSNMDPQD